MNDKSQMQFSLKTLFAVTALLAVLAYSVKSSILALLLVQIILPTAIGFGIRKVGMWMPDKVRFWAAVILLLAASFTLLIYGSSRFSSQLGDPTMVVAISLACWVPQLILMDFLIRHPRS